MKELILGSDAVSLMSPLLLREELDAGKVVALGIELASHNDFDLCMMRMTGRTASPAARLLLECFAEIVQPG